MPNEAVEASLARLVELTLTRLEEAGVVDTRLREEWDAIQGLDEDEVSYVEAAARLGLDPFQVPEDIAEVMINAAGILPVGVLDDFFDAADPHALSSALSWVADVSSYIEGVTAPPRADIADLKSITDLTGSLPNRGPWQVGYARANAVRKAVKVSPTMPFPIADFVSSSVYPSARRELDGYGQARNGVRLVRSRSVSVTGERFAAARALWHGLNRPANTSFLLTRAKTSRQKAERAFAAELLAPASGIEMMLQEVGPLWDDQDIDDLAKHFDVRSEVVELQIENNRRR